MPRVYFWTVWFGFFVPKPVPQAQVSRNLMPSIITMTAGEQQTIPSKMTAWRSKKGFCLELQNPNLSETELYVLPQALGYVAVFPIGQHR